MLSFIEKFFIRFAVRIACCPGQTVNGLQYMLTEVRKDLKKNFYEDGNIAIDDFLHRQLTDSKEKDVLSSQS